MCKISYKNIEKIREKSPLSPPEIRFLRTKLRFRKTWILKNDKVLLEKKILINNLKNSLLLLLLIWIQNKKKNKKQFVYAKFKKKNVQLKSEKDSFLVIIRTYLVNLTKKFIEFYLRNYPRKLKTVKTLKEKGAGTPESPPPSHGEKSNSNSPRLKKKGFHEIHKEIFSIFFSLNLFSLGVFLEIRKITQNNFNLKSKLSKLKNKIASINYLNKIN